tara:strand:- start:6763 stop:9810 length:3048 start_codon:yes stop_codon:yes gene_type:complete
MISIQILDYVYSADVNNQVNMNNVTALNGWNIVNTRTANFPTVSGSVAYILPVTGLLTYNLTYDVSLTVSDYSGSGDIGFSSLDSGGSPNGMGSSFMRSSNGTTTGSFTVLYGNKDAQIFADNGATGTIRASITQSSANPSINFNESVVGSLDVGDSEDFPLALTFGVSDIRDIQARSGAYSKTFEIPATKNNNKIFKAVYYEESFIPNNFISNKKPCRILVDDNYSITGQLQLVAIGKSTSPSYYSCVFYGDNIDWASSLDNKLLKDLSTIGGVNGSGWDSLNGKTGTGIDLGINLTEISSTWEVVDAENTQPSGGAVTTNTLPIVYPIVSYGENNPDGISATIQCLKTCYEANGFGAGGYWGWDNSSNSYGTPKPSCDWRPCIFIYDILKQIFFQEGYTIVSNFIETDMFKKLIMALPNFNYNNVDERVSDNSWEGTYNDGSACVDGDCGAIERFNWVSGALNQNDWEYPQFTIDWNDDGQLVENTDYTPAIYNGGSEFTMQEYGFYDINLNSLSVWIESTCYGAATATDVTIGYIQIRIEVKTVGQTTWNVIDYVYLYGDASFELRYINCTKLGTSGFPQSINADNYTYSDRYLNKGDKVRFRYVYKVKHSNANGKTIGLDTTLYGGNSPSGTLSSGRSSRNGVVSFIHKGEHAEYGQTYDLKNVIDSSSTQMGFIKGVSHAFNLQFITDTVSKIVTIEPFNDFYKTQSEAVDWSAKVDFSQNQVDKWVPTELLREVIFKFISDSNDKVVEHRGQTYWDNILDEFPYREFLSNEFAAGKVIFENPFFAGTFNVRNGLSNGTEGVENAPWGAVLWGDCNTTPPSTPTGGGGCRPSKGYNFVPRLLNWTRLQCPTYIDNQAHLVAMIQTWISTRTIWSAPVVGQTSKIYPQANSYDNFNTTTPLLTYASHYIADRDCLTGFVSANIVVKGLYQTYYQKQIEMMKKSPRLKTINLNLKLSDIQTLDLRKLVYIDGSYYRINQVLDFQPNNNSTTKVELILWEEQGNFPAVIASGF